jgi:hypothetical protein
MAHARALLWSPGTTLDGRRCNSQVATEQIRRSWAETTALLDGPEIVPPGVVQCHRWRPCPGADVSREVSGWAAVARKK